VPATALSAFRHLAGLVFYLDTSAVFPLALVAAGSMKPINSTRSGLVKAFCADAQRASSRAVVSVLVLEEIAAKTRNEAQRDLLRAEGFDDWYAFEQADKARADAERLNIKGRVLSMLQHAADELGMMGVTVEQPLITGTPADAGKKLRKTHREFLSKYQNIDSMDALHIAVGGLLGCKHFLSFDTAWIDIAEIQLLQ